MFEGFAHVWTPVALSSELRANAALAVQVAGTKVVLFRDAQGRAHALLDQCPHRGVALSLGKVRDGRVECPFHGWQVDGSGAVCSVPWNPDAKLDKLRGVAFAVRELAQQIWLYTAPGLEPDSEPDVLEALQAPGVRISGFSIEWQTHWTRAMENMLDWPHLPFVHAKTIGGDLRGRESSRMEVAWEEKPWGAHTYIHIDGHREPGALDLRWPNQMNLHIPVPGKLLMMLVACVPVDQHRTRMMMTMARGFLTHPAFDWFFHRTNKKIAYEDKAIVESSSPACVPPAKDERSVRTDVPTLAFRKRYFAELHDSSADFATNRPPGAHALPLVRDVERVHPASAPSARQA